MHHTTASSDGTPIAHEVHGTDGPPIVLAGQDHGAPAEVVAHAVGPFLSARA